LFYPFWQRGATGLSNLVPFALIDALVIAMAGWLLFAGIRTVVRAHRGGWAASAISVLMHVATLAAVVYVAFLMSWGFNYRRTPLTSKIRYEPSAVTPERARELALATVREVNELYGRARASGFASGVDSLHDAFANVQSIVRVARPALPGRPKLSLLDIYFRAAGVEGMTNPFFLETLVAGDLLPFERPFVIAHEWSHLAGFADEGEANFVGWLTCARASDAARYSGSLFLYTQILAALDDADRKAIAGGLAPGPRADLREAAERSRRNVKPAVAGAGWRVYDRYLKANRIDAGTASYAEVVRLVLGLRLDPA
jgi:hypothetical protein